MRRLSVDVTPSFCIFWAAAILILPLGWIVAVLTAALFHECCHYIVLKLCGLSVFRITIGARGAQIETEPMTPFQELLCAMAGPTGSFLLLSTVRWFPLLAICGGIQGIYNLLPVMPFDGGRIIKSLYQIVKRFWVEAHPRKRPCKEGLKRVQ